MKYRPFVSIASHASVVLAVLIGQSPLASSDHSRKVHIVNGGGAKVDVFWLDESGRIHLIKEKLSEDDGVLDLNSFVNHTFMLQEVPTNGARTCEEAAEVDEDGTCRSTHVTVGEEDDQGEEREMDAVRSWLEFQFSFQFGHELSKMCTS